MGLRRSLPSPRTQRQSLHRSPCAANDFCTALRSRQNCYSFVRLGQHGLDPVPGASSGGQGAVAGDIAPTGLEVLVKTYTSVYYWSRGSGAETRFAHPSITLPYAFEPQGEAIAWAADSSGYYTVSEEARSIPATLYFYPRLSEE